MPPGDRKLAAKAAVPALAERLGLQNEFNVGTSGHPPKAIAFLRRKDATAADVDDDELLGADAIVHIASGTQASAIEFCTGLARMLGQTIKHRVLDGVVRPPTYTSNAMHDFAYANQVVQQPGTAMPNAFLVPMSKGRDWWRKHWMERHTYFLPRYDESGRMLSEGHALSAQAGISCLMRRTYKNREQPAPAGAYDFINYFECADESVSTYHQVVAALRDVKRNPEWQFVREGPTWHGRRVATWPELFQ